MVARRFTRVIMVIAIGGILVVFIVYHLVGLVRQESTEGLEVAAVASRSYSGSTSAGTVNVVLDVGIPTRVGWDGKAVAVIAIIQRYWILEGGIRVYSSIGYAYGVRGSEPWWILPGECYKVRFIKWLHREARLIAKREIIIPLKNGRLLLPLRIYEVSASALFEFSSGLRDWFGNYNYTCGRYVVLNLKAIITLGPQPPISEPSINYPHMATWCPFIEEMPREVELS